jgi:hypothetical protein
MFASMPHSLLVNLAGNDESSAAGANDARRAVAGAARFLGLLAATPGAESQKGGFLSFGHQCTSMRCFIVIP